MKILVKPGLEIGDGCEPFIIAEVGSNWSTLEDCLTSITQAKLAGADVVKFQLYDGRSLYGVDWETGKHLPVGQMSREMPGEMPLSWLPKLSEKAKAVGIEFMCSVFNPNYIEIVNMFVNVHKVASSEMCHVRMLERLREIGKPVILSTGAQTEADISKALEILGDTPTILMYCVAAYPANEVSLDVIPTMRVHFARPVGFSDHSTDVACIPVMAHRSGACVIEKHVNFVGAHSPDAPHSLSGRDFSRMVQCLHGRSRLDIGPTESEQGMITRHKRRLIATRDIAGGEQLTEGVNFGIYRSLKDDTHAFSPFLIDHVNGQTAKRAIQAGDGIGPGDV